MLRALFVAWVALTILGTQAVGFVHRIEHGHSGGSLQSSESSAGVDRGARHVSASLEAHPPAAALESAAGLDREHSCAAIDALALGDGPPSAAISVVATPPAEAASPPSAPAGPDAAPRLPYFARAPPAFS